jgi:hypothetical protein
MATVNQMMPRSGQPKRFSFHMETNDKTTRITPRNTISRRLKALNVSSGCTRFGVVALFVLGRLRWAFCLSVWLRFTGFLCLWDFPISHPRKLFYDLAT